MEKEIIKKFEGKHVKLVQNNNFILTGKILEVFNDTVLFQTEQANSAIDIGVIKEIIERR